MRFILFAGQNYDGTHGVGEALLHADTMGEIETALEALKEAEMRVDWWQVLDLLTMRVVAGKAIYGGGGQGTVRVPSAAEVIAACEARDEVIEDANSILEALRSQETP